VVVNDWNVDHPVRLSRSDHFVNTTDKPDTVGTELSVEVGIEDRHVLVVHQLNSPDPVVRKLRLQPTDVIQQHLRGLFVTVNKQDIFSIRQVLDEGVSSICKIVNAARIIAAQINNSKLQRSPSNRRPQRERTSIR